MKRIKQINKWIILERRENDPYYNSVEKDRNYVVKSPKGIISEDRLTLQEAEEFCVENKDFIITNEQREKDKFLKIIKNGAWFHLDDETLIKFSATDEGDVTSLWISINDPELMRFCENDNNDWKYDFKRKTFIRYSSFIYNFGSYEKDKDDKSYIYNEDDTVNYDVVKEVIMRESEISYNNMVTKEELDMILEKLFKRQGSEYPKINIE